MDTQTQNKDGRKKGGIWASLFGEGVGAGGGGAAGAGSTGFGSSGGWAALLGRGGLAGGLMATKAGLVGLILAATTMAGGIGWLGYRAFGPSRADNPDASFANLFAPRPAQPASSGGSAAGGSQLQVPGSAGSSSLQELQQANASAPAPSVSQSAQDQAAQQAAAQKAAAVAAAEAAKKAANGGNVFGDKAAKLKSNMQVGKLSQFGAGGANSSASLSAGKALAASAAKPVTAFASAAHPMAAPHASLMHRAFGSGAMGQLQSAGTLSHGQTLMTNGAGHTFDGGGSGIGSGGGLNAGGAGVGNPGAGTNPTNPTNGGTTSNQFPAPPPAYGTNVTPWQTAINIATGLIAVASLLIFMGQKIAKGDRTIVMVLAAIVAALGAFVMYLGGMIAGGQYGQTYQGGMFVMAGAALIAGGAGMMLSNTTTTTAAGKTVPGPEANIGKWIMYISGAAALGLDMMSYLRPKASYLPTQFPNGVAPDFGYVQPAPRVQYAMLGELHGSDRDS